MHGTGLVQLCYSHMEMSLEKAAKTALGCKLTEATLLDRLSLAITIVEYPS